MTEYRTPSVVDFGSIARHTFFPVGATTKGGEDIWHCDMHNERSGGSGTDFPGTSKDTCIGRT